MTQNPEPETPQDQIVAEIPTSKPPVDEIPEPPTVPVVTTGIPDAGATNDQLERIGKQVREILSYLPDYVTGFVKDNQKPLTTVGLLIAALVSLRVLVAVLEVLNGIPLVQPTFEIVGMAYSGWFIYRYLLSAATRQELSAKVEEIKEQITGNHSPKP
nr:CAAD domain-containing protein [Phormidium pseudopriestleyi]